MRENRAKRSRMVRFLIAAAIAAAFGALSGAGMASVVRNRVGGAACQGTSEPETRVSRGAGNISLLYNDGNFTDLVCPIPTDSTGLGTKEINLRLRNSQLGTVSTAIYVADYSSSTVCNCGTITQVQ